jgi:hypothetical protein
MGDEGHWKVVPTRSVSLLPPFMMREPGVIVKDTPKLQLEDYALTFPETGFRIPLPLWGDLSYF